MSIDKDPNEIHQRVPFDDCSDNDEQECGSIESSVCLPESWNLRATNLLLLFFICIALISILGEDIMPGSELFALLMLAMHAHMFGVVVTSIKLPPLIGMLIVGFLFRNLPFIPFYENITNRWATTLRTSAFVIILLKAGLGLDAEKLKKLSRIVFQLAFCPCIVETIAAAITSHFFLGLPWMWAIMLGFVISAVSPAVIVPGLLNLQKRQMGTKKGIPTLVIAAASVDDIIAITGFSVMLSVTLSEGSLKITILKGILEPIVGLMFGTFFGRLLWGYPASKEASGNLAYYRILLLCSGGFAAMFLSQRCYVAGVGPMACLVLAFYSALGWKKNPEQFEKIESVIGNLWTVLQPFLFSLIGASVSVSDLQCNLGKTILALLIALVFRILTATFATFSSDLNIKEKIFVALAWLPKATVQAAVGSQALDYVLTNKKGPEMEKNAQTVLTAAVVAIIMTAPIGAALIALLGPVLLTYDGDKKRIGKNMLRVVDREVQL